MSTSTAAKEEAQSAGSQTLLRGLDVIEAVAVRPMSLGLLADTLGLSRSTTHRLASALVERGYLAAAAARTGYRLGPRLLSLGATAQAQADFVQVARPHLERLALATDDTVHLGVQDADQALYLDKVPGRRRINISSQVGERQPLSCTGLGKALMLDHPPAYRAARLAADQAAGAPPIDPAVWAARMDDYARSGHAYDLEENEDRIRCVAAPVRDARGAIIGAISVASAAHYMDDARMAELSVQVRDTADAISRDLGWRRTKPES